MKLLLLLAAAALPAFSQSCTVTTIPAGDNTTIFELFCPAANKQAAATHADLSYFHMSGTAPEFSQWIVPLQDGIGIFPVTLNAGLIIGAPVALPLPRAAETGGRSRHGRR
jgi:hypothetical protein